MKKSSTVVCGLTIVIPAVNEGRTDHLFFFPRMLRWLRPLEPMLVIIPVGAQYLGLARKT
jgi:hypothetical protein